MSNMLLPDQTQGAHSSTAEAHAAHFMTYTDVTQKHSTGGHSPVAGPRVSHSC